MRKLFIYGRHEVIEEMLTDGSAVYSVVTPSDDGAEVIFACVSEEAARKLASALQNGCVDVSLRDREGVL